MYIKYLLTVMSTIFIIGCSNNPCSCNQNIIVERDLKNTLALQNKNITDEATKISDLLNDAVFEYLQSRENPRYKPTPLNELILYEHPMFDENGKDIGPIIPDLSPK